MIKIGVSACLLGQNVRYNGKNKYINLEKYFPKDKYKLIAICPEVEMGMAIPRPPIEIVNTNIIRLVQVGDHSIDFTEQMIAWFEQNKIRFAGIDKFVLKSKSPSCGNQTTKHFIKKGDFFYADGLFVSLLKQFFPHVKILSDKNIPFLQEPV